MTKAQVEFINRKESINTEPQDARVFLTWYHEDDIHRIAYAMYQAQPQKTQDMIHPPVMVIASDYHSFNDKMMFCLDLLDNTNYLILPFIIAPEIGSVHFMSGFIRYSNENYELFLFNPTGYTRDKACKRLAIDDIDNVSGMTMQVSSPAVQTVEKDQTELKSAPALVSCGPISLMFIESLLQNPGYAFQLNESFELPRKLSELEAKDKEAYQHFIIEQRQAHYELLASIDDELLESVDEMHSQTIQKFLKAEWKNQKNLSNSSIYDDDCSTDSIHQEEKYDESQNDKSQDDQSLIQLNVLFNLEQFNVLLTQLKVKTKELISAASYNNAESAANQLISRLETARDAFCENEIDADSLVTFKQQCTDAIEEAKPVFQKCPSWWQALNPLIKGFIGLLAALFIVPALIVHSTARHGYMGTFFSGPQTTVLTENLNEIANELQDCFIFEL